MGKGSATTTTTTAPNPVAGRNYKEVLNRASDVASTPYQAYQGELVAPINAQQQMAINNINQNAGFAMPYMQQAGQMIQNAAGPLQWQQWMNPYQQQVIDATMAQFNEQNQRQQQGILGNAIQQNALGGDRVSVAQSELARQQSLAQMPVIANLYSQGFQNALQTAQQQQQAQMAAAYGLGNIGVAGQQAALQGAGAQFGAGTAQQQTQQMLDAANYGQFVQEQAFPYAQTQWQAGIVGGIAPNLGGTTTQTAPPPSPWNTIGGLAMAGIGAASGNPMMVGSGLKGAGTGWAQVPAPGGGTMPQATWRDAGGRVAGFADGGMPAPYGAGLPYGGVSWLASGMPQARPNFPQPPQQPQSSGMGDISSLVQTALNAKKLAGLFAADGGFVPPPGPDSILVPRGYDEGGVAGFPLLFQDRAQPVQDAITSGEFDPQGINSTTFAPPPVPQPPPGPSMFAGVPVDSAKPLAGVMLPPEITHGTSRPPAPAAPTSDDALAFDGTPQAGFAPPPVAAAPQSGSGNLFGLSDEARMGLIAAGLGMAASRSPFPGVALGEGGLQGINTYRTLRRDRRQDEKTRFDMQHAVDTLNQRAKIAKDALEETKRGHDLTDAMRRDALEERRQAREDTAAYRQQTLDQGRLAPGFRWKDGKIGVEQEFIPGGVADPDQIKKQTEAKVKAGGLLDDETIQDMAAQYLAGDKSVFQNLGRGAQGAENVVRLRSEVSRQMRAAGMSPQEMATRMANFAGVTAAMRTLGTRGVNVEYAANTANRAIDLAEEALSNVPRTQFVPFNKLKQLYDSNMSSPQQAAFYAATNTLVNEYARVAAGGSNQSTEGMRHHAREMLNTAMGPEAYRATLNMMRREIQQAKAAYEETRKEFLQGAHGPHDKKETGDKSGKPKTEREKALDWANANPDDPRAKEIKKRLGVP